MSRKLCTRNILDSNPPVFKLDGIWEEVLGSPERNGAWLIWGKEKNGKTSFALQLANYLSRSQKKEVKGKLVNATESVWYISAEEGLGANFKAALIRVGIPHDKKALFFSDFQTLDEIRKGLVTEKLKDGKLEKKRTKIKIVFLDNITVYADYLKQGALRELTEDFKDVLFIFLAHEERGDPATAVGKLCRKLAKVIVHVKGMACTVSGRCPGGKLVIDEEKAAICHGQD